MISSSIGELIKRKSKRRQQEARQQEREEQELGILNINRPTLPDVHVDLTRKSSGNTQYNYVFKSRTPQMGYAGSQPGYAGSQPGHADSEIDSYYGTNHMYPNRAESEYSSDYAGDGNSEYTSASHLARVRQYHPNPTTQMNPTQLPHRDASRWGNPNVN